MSSDDPYLHAPEIPPGCCKHGMPHKFGCDDCTIERLHAENAELRKKVGACKMLERAQAEQLSTLREQQDKFREAVASLQSERDANAILTAEIDAYRAAMREALEVLQDGREALREQAEEFHRSMRGYKPERHEYMDEAVRRADAAIEKLKARTG